MFTDDLVTILVQANVGVFGVDIFVGSKSVIPPGDGPYLNIRETGGAAPEIIQNTPDVPGYVRPSAQIMTRGIDYRVARVMAQNAYDALYSIQNQFVDGTWWRSVLVTSEPRDLEEDEKGRTRFAFNIDCIKRSSPATS